MREKKLLWRTKEFVTKIDELMYHLFIDFLIFTDLTMYGYSFPIV